MPYKIVKKGDEYCVAKQSDGKIMGCHDTREKAADQIAAIEISEGEHSTMAEDLRVLGVLSANGNPTGDKRTIAKPALRWSLPLPLRRQREDFGGHNGAVVVGAIEDIKQTPTGELMYSAKLFDTPDGRAAYDEMYARYAASGLKYGVSVDLDDVIMEEDPDDPEMAIVTSARLRGATLCDIPAYSTAYAVLANQLQSLVASAGFLEISADLFDMVRAAGFIEPVDVREDGVILYDFTPPALVAAGAPRADLPRAWFENPRLRDETPMTVTPDGRIFGHCATWRTCHTAFGDRCITPPRSATNYAYFRTGVVEAEGVQIPVGHITMGAGHADTRLAAGPAAEHYDNVTSIIADVVAGEDEHGIWLAGAIREGVTPEQVRELMATAPSGDWRIINGNLEMVAVLNVVSPGFPVPRMRAMVASGEVTSLVASACFESEANVDENVETPAEDVAVEVEPSVDPAEVAPEVVAAEMAPAEPVAEVEEAEEVEETPDADESPVVDLAEVAALVSELKSVLAELKAAKGEVAEVIEDVEEPAEEVEPVEALPAVERSQEDILAALDAIVNGPTKDVHSILAELDAKVG